MARDALAVYDLPPTAELKPLGAGLTSTFEVTAADERYAMRVHRPGYRTPTNTRAELGYLTDLCDALADTAVLLPRPKPTRDGDLVLEAEEILSPSDRADLQALADRTHAVFTELADEFGVIHADFILGNLHLSRGDAGWQVGVFDFEDSGIGCFVYDLCPLLGSLAGFPGGTLNPDYPVLRAALLDGYRSERWFPWNGSVICRC